MKKIELDILSRTPTLKGDIYTFKDDNGKEVLVVTKSYIINLKELYEVESTYLTEAIKLLTRLV